MSDVVDESPGEQPLQLVAAKIGLDLDIFELLKQEHIVSLERLVAKTGAEKRLLGMLIF